MSTSAIEHTSKNKPVIEQELRLSKADLVDMAFHLQQKDFEQAAFLEEKALTQLEKQLKVTALAAVKKKHKGPIQKVGLVRWNNERVSVELTLMGSRFSGAVSFREIGPDFTKQVAELRRREKALQDSRAHFSLMRKNRGRFKREYLSRLLETTPEGKQLLEQLRTVTFKLGEAPSLPESIKRLR